MIIIGANGFAKEVLEILYQLGSLEKVVFFDDVSHDLSQKMYDRFEILKNTKQVKNYFENVSPEFTIGIGNPNLRRRMHDTFIKLGGSLVSTISPKAVIGHFGNEIGIGCNIITGAVIDNSVTIGKGCLINTNSIIGHDVNVGCFVEICPGVVVSGYCEIGDYSFIGSNATILPNIKIGSNVVVAAGSVVKYDVPDNCMIAGMPAIIKKKLPKLEF
ncbi:MAG: acetyltransferase [Bacteroidota bacterium]|nr:acetyltransferase [Bacteroidota bacterium]